MSSLNYSLLFCLDINECYQSIDYCPHPKSYCNNTVGSFQCLCGSGYTGNGTVCEGKRAVYSSFSIFKILFIRSFVHLLLCNTLNIFSVLCTIRHNKKDDGMLIVKTVFREFALPACNDN